MSNNPLLDRIIKNSSTKNTSVLSKSVFFQDKDIIPTDLPILNIAFSGSPVGGLTSGLTTIAGVSRTFKSLLGLLCVKAYLDKYSDAVAILYDSEGGITPEYLKSNGINPDRIVHVPIEHLEMLKFDMVKTLKEIDRKDHVVMMIDSLGNTASLKELEDAENEKSVAEMQRAKTMKGLTRMITPSLIAKDVPCIAVSHVYNEMGTMYPKTIISGGTGILLSSNQAFIITKSQEKDGTDLAGWKFTINVEKSRFVREKSKLSFTVLYDSGIQKWSGLFDLAVDAGFILKPKQGWYQLVDPTIGEISSPLEKNFRQADVMNNNTFFETLIRNEKFIEAVEKRFKLLAHLNASPVESLTYEEEEFENHDQ
jgi:RecA/RadA recombinase